MPNGLILFVFRSLIGSVYGLFWVESMSAYMSPVPRSEQHWSEKNKKHRDANNWIAKTTSAVVLAAITFLNRLDRCDLCIHDIPISWHWFRGRNTFKPAIVNSVG